MTKCQTYRNGSLKKGFIHRKLWRGSTSPFIIPPLTQASSGVQVLQISCLKPDRQSLPPNIYCFCPSRVPVQSAPGLYLIEDFLVQAISQAYSCKSEFSLLPNPYKTFKWEKKTKGTAELDQLLSLGACQILVFDISFKVKMRIWGPLFTGVRFLFRARLWTRG